MADKINTLLDKYGQTFCEEIGIHLENKPAALFQWFCCSMLFSARINSDISVNAAKGLLKEGLTTPEKVMDSTWKERVGILNEANYTRYQEKTSTFLSEIAQLLQDKYGGDLRVLREEAGKDPQKIRKKLKEFKGVGDVGIDIFFRETQLLWEELFPFLDDKAKAAAGKMNIPKSAQGLLNHVDKDHDKYVKLISALIRVDLENDYDLNKATHQNKRLEELTKNELYKKAVEQNIQGRSKMNKKALVKKLE